MQVENVSFQYFSGAMDVDSCMARLAQTMNDNEPALVAARAERYGNKKIRPRLRVWSCVRCPNTVVVRGALCTKGHGASRICPYKSAILNS